MTPIGLPHDHRASCDHRICSIIPPQVLDHIANQAASPTHRDAARQALQHLYEAHDRREAARVQSLLARPARAEAAPAAAKKERVIYSCEGTQTPHVKLERREDDPASTDTEVNEAYDYAGITWDFYWEILKRDSIDASGLPLVSNVHMDARVQNAYWDGTQMFYSDPTPGLFNRFTIALDVVAHELTHGVTQNTAGLAYRSQSGALNESISDVFGSMVKQWKQNQNVTQADWLIGAGLFVQVPGRKRAALRSMMAPGTAYDDPEIGRDIQPAHMDGYRALPETRQGDWGGVHINSGIPNHAFYLVATSLGGNSWDRAGKIWYQALTQRLQPNDQFADMKEATVAAATDLYNTEIAQIVTKAWNDVGV
jgi:Zn-dependent metalloprotease